MTEEYRVPDGMVGLSEYMHICFLNHRHDARVAVLRVFKLNSQCLNCCPFTVIGRGGEQINKIQQDSGCKVQIAHGELCANPRFSESTKYNV